MPFYVLHCDTCGYEADALLSVEEFEQLGPCPSCERGKMVTDWDRRGPPKIQRTWHGRETVSLGHGLDPKQVAGFQEENPAWEFDRAGNAVFNSDAHMRQCLKQQADYNRRDQERHDERLAKMREAGQVPHDPMTGQELPMERTDLG